MYFLLNDDAQLMHCRPNLDNRSPTKSEEKNRETGMSCGITE